MDTFITKWICMMILIQESSCQYWPVEGQVAQFGEFTVELIGQEDLNGFTIRTLEIQQSKVRTYRVELHTELTYYYRPTRPIM